MLNFDVFIQIALWNGRAHRHSSQQDGEAPCARRRLGTLSLFSLAILQAVKAFHRCFILHLFISDVQNLLMGLLSLALFPGPNKRNR